MIIKNPNNPEEHIVLFQENDTYKFLRKQGFENYNDIVLSGYYNKTNEPCEITYQDLVDFIETILAEKMLGERKVQK
jgi:hypothetical protein